MGQISGEWLAALQEEFHQPYYAKLYKTVMNEYKTRKIFPPPQDMFNAFEFTPLAISRTMAAWKSGRSREYCF